LTKRVPVIAGNWKMNTDLASGVALAQKIADICNGLDDVEKVVCPPYVSLVAVSEALSDSDIGVGAQNVSSEPDGALTGEVSTTMLKNIADYVIVGHSERRANFSESSQDIAAKAISASNSGFTVILCVGEDLGVRQSGKATEFVSQQLNESLQGFTNWDSLIVAYEPVWAIGTGEAATPEQANDMASTCRSVVDSLSGGLGDSIRVLYGGSVKSSNIGSLVAQADIDGALVGGASLDADEFSKLIASAAGN